jgi:hypothetical protein
MSLLGEWEAIGEVLANYQALGLQGGVILIDDRVQAFSCGELINKDTAVIPSGKSQPRVAEPLRGDQSTVHPGGLGQGAVHQSGAGPG